jgi:UDP-N-acetylmuramoyl-L-alanyl-D-glutamate--2,6-diaminopimelate ligase
VKNIAAIIQDIPVRAIHGRTDLVIDGLTIDSRKAAPGMLFFAQKGTVTDGHQYIPAVIEAGAIAIVCKELPEILNPEVCYIQVDEVAPVIGLMASAFYGHPTRKLQVVGVTGTNGKTSVATLLYKLFNQLDEPSGLVSTVENRIRENVIPSTHTTPDPVSLQALFRQMVDAGCTYAFMEVSSHAVHQHRIAGITFRGGIFTNITHDHLDYHKTFDEYIRVKKQFFDHLPKGTFALTNIDDKRGMVMLQNTKAAKKAYGLRVPCDFKGKVFENNLTGLLMNVDGQDVHFRMSGLFNAYNLLAVYGAAVLCGQDKIDVLTALSNMQGAAGRFETYHSATEKILGIIDYAHTPDALQNVLSTIKQFGQQANIITVIGCGGDRDKLKRPEMAQVACELSSKVILTSDNPRSEDPEAILDDMEAGLTPGMMRKALRISDRKAAIKTAVSMAHADDVILVAGKGHETYQEIKGVRHHFDDREVLLEMFKLLEK